MSLLDDVSIVVTPNAYKAGRLYGVLPTATLGSEQVTNGDFATNSDWDLGSSWTISGGKANYDAVTSASELRQLMSSIAAGKIVKIQFDISDVAAGKDAFFKLEIDGSPEAVFGYTKFSAGTYTYYHTIANAFNRLTFFPLNTSTGGAFSIDNISVKEWTASDMDVTRATAATRVDENGLVNYAEVLGSEEVTNGSFNTTIPIGNNGSGWAKVIAGSCTVEYDNGGVKLTQASVGNQDCKIYARTVGGSDNLLTVGKQYKVTYEVLSNNNSTVLKYYRGGTYLQIDHTVGTHTFYYEQESNQLSIFWNLTANSDITLDNISIKEADRNNVPRIDYTGGGCPHILSEPQRTNLLTYSEDFTQWGVGESVVVANQLTSPSGEITADKLNALNPVNQQYISVSPTVSSGSVYTLSCFAKKGEIDYVALVGLNPFTISYFDLNNGTNLSNTGTISSSIEDFGNGWYRCTSTFDADTTSKFSGIYLSYNGTTISNGTNISNGEGVYVWGAQLEEGSYPTSYIPTSGSAVTRNQDVFTRDGIASLINSTEGVLFLEVAAFITTSPIGFITLNDGSGNNKVAFYYNSVLNTIIFECLVGGATQASFTYTSSNITNFNKVAFSWKLNQFKLFANGNQVGSTDTSGSVNSAGTLNKLSFDYGGSGVHDFQGKVKQLQVYKTALTDAQLTSLTS